MQRHALIVLSLVEIAFLGLLLLILPRIGRRGLLFALRHGQGGARHEGSTSAPLTDGLADNRYWWGVFYVNREDPSILVEHRFGLGYTLNHGNRLAVALLAGFFILVLGLSLLTALSI